MKTTLKVLSLCALLSSPVPAQAQAPAPGIWEGAISVPGMEMSVSVTLNRAGDTWTGTIDIPAQGAKGIPLGSIAMTGNSVSFTIQGAPGQPTFKGTSTAEGKSMSGDLVQGAGSFPFKLTWKNEAKPAAQLEVVNGAALEGTWQGLVTLNGMQFRIVFKAIKAPDGSVSAIFSSPDQGPGELPVARTGFKDSKVRFEIPTIGATFEGTLGTDGAINGTFMQGPGTWPLVLKKV